MLTDDQIVILKENSKKDLSLKEFIDLVYPGENVDSRSKAGRDVREFLNTLNVSYTTSQTLARDSIEFSESQKQLIISEARRNVGSYVITQQAFSDDVVKNGVEHKAVLAFIKNCEDDVLEGTGATNTYQPPKSIGRLLPKLNSAIGGSYTEDKLDKTTRNRLDKLLINLNQSRIVTVVNNYTKPKNRELFLDEFMRMTWDKPDLAADELNLYISVSKDIVNIEELTRHIDKLNGFFDDVEEAGEATVKLSEMIKTKTDEKHKIEVRIRDVTKMMNTNRSSRLAEKNKKSSSFLNIVQAFQEEEERLTMVKMARFRNEIVKKGLQELEDMSEWRARILGIEMDDIV